MRAFPTPQQPPSLDGLTFRRLERADAGRIIELQAVMLAALPHRHWYYPSPEAMFADCCERGETFGYFDGERLAGFATLTPWYVRGENCYAAKAGQPVEDTYDFQDVMVHPDYRRRGVHSAFLALFERMAREAGGAAMYCTIAPDNAPSVASFTKAGYRCVVEKPAYEGMLRGYFRKELR